MNLKSDVIIIATKLKDDIVEQLKTIEETDPDIENAITYMVEEIQNSDEDIEIYYIGNCYIVTDKCIFIAAYPEELKEIENE